MTRNPYRRAAPKKGKAMPIKCDAPSTVAPCPKDAKNKITTRIYGVVYYRCEPHTTDLRIIAEKIEEVPGDAS